MAGYSSFSMKAVKKQFNLVEKRENLFPNPCTLQPSEWLLTTLARHQRIISFNNEKSRSEFIVAPILSEVADLNIKKVSFFSGENLDVDKAQSLTGECDFIFTNTPESSTIECPIFSMVECENDNVNTGLGQCVAQLVGARLYNEREGNELPYLYGCVTTGYDWLFLKLENQYIYRHHEMVMLGDLSKILSTFQFIIDKF
jgi:hypothetical protein